MVCVLSWWDGKYYRNFGRRFCWFNQDFIQIWENIQILNLLEPVSKTEIGKKINRPDCIQPRDLPQLWHYLTLDNLLCHFGCVHFHVQVQFGCFQVENKFLLNWDESGVICVELFQGSLEHIWIWNDVWELF